MNIVVSLAKSTLNFIVVNAILIAADPQDATFYIGAVIAVAMGFLLRVMIELKNHTFTWRNSFIQAVMSLCLCYLCALGYRDFGLRFKIEWYLFFCSCFSVFIVGLLEKTMKMGLTSYARFLLRKVMADDPKPSDHKSEQEETK